jgi:hypothetical protein
LCWKTGKKEVLRGSSGHFSKANWGDRIETRDGRIIVVKQTTSLITLTSKLKDIQWTKIVDAASELVERQEIGEDIDVIAEDSSDFELEDGDSDIVDEEIDELPDN